MFDFRRLFKRKRVMMVAMRYSDMLRVRPDMVVLRCGRCAQQVGLYPSGQRVMRRYGKRVDLICQVCHPDSDRFILAPGATEKLISLSGGNAKRGPAPPYGRLRAKL